jgi:UDP-N-acetylmuramate--alanine ligase
MIAPGHYHLVGVAGVGMSALAQALLAEGCEVSGSDRHADRGTEVEGLAQLAGGGVRVVSQDGTGVSPDTAAVVVSTAIEEGNPDLLAAARMKVPVLHRADVLAALLEGRRSLAVTGTCGKSTVTGMIGWILDCCGHDPTVVNGAPVINWQDERRIGNMRPGRSGLWVIEADESDRSLLRYRPTWGLITNASRDHFDMEETRRVFAEFRGRVSEWCLSTLDEPGLLSGFDPVSCEEGVGFTWEGRDILVPLLGRHNAENALLAASACLRLGCPRDGIAAALRSFRGIRRRIERVGIRARVTVYDDYAHNPAKIAATWHAVAPRHRRIIAVWRPHGFGPLAAMMDDLAQCFGALCRDPHRLVLLPVYDAGGTANRSVDSSLLEGRLRGQGIAVSVLQPADVVADVVAGAAPGDAVVVMGARDPGLPGMARALLRRLGGGAAA